MASPSSTSAGARGARGASRAATTSGSEPARGPMSAHRLQALPRLAGRVREQLGARLRRSERTHPTDDAAPAMDTESGTDWGRVGVFGAGLAVGVLLGAGTALLLAPHTGLETRVRLSRGARHAGDRVTERWDDLAEAVRRGASRGQRGLKRKVTRGRWAAEDAWERRLAMARARVGEG